MTKIAVREEKISSSVKYSLPAYHSIEGLLKNTYFFRLDRNEIIRFDESTFKITHFRGIPEDSKVYCVVLLE